MLRDLRFAARSFLRTPRFTIPAVLALALGIGATSAVFSVIKGVLLTPLPYRDPDRIVVVWENNLKRSRTRNVIAPSNFVEWRARNRSFEYLGMAGPARITVRLGSEPEEFAGMAASSDVFPALGVTPARGRAYTAVEDEEGHDNVVVISHELWQTRLGGAANVVGTTLTANGVPRTIVGVMPPGFTLVGQRADFLIPYGWTLQRLRSAPGRGMSFGVARLRPGVSLSQATSDMKGLAAQLAQEKPQLDTGWSVTLVPVHEQVVDEIRPALRVLAGAVALLLLIGCVNVANLLLARGAVRQREIGLRAALGAGRLRLVRQMLTESLLLGALGGAAGLALALAFHRGLLALVATRVPIPRLDQVTLDLPVVAFTVLLALATGLLFGFLPSLVASRSVADALREGGRSAGGRAARRALGTLVVAEIALSLVLLTGAGLLIRSFVRLQHVETGMRAEGVLTARVQLPASRYAGPEPAARFYSDAVARIATLPGVRDAAGVSFLPLSGPGIATSFYPADQPAPLPGESPTTQVRPITPGFFRTMGIARRLGRDFSPADQLASPKVAIIGETLARRYLPGRDPIGARLHVSIGEPGGRTVEVVGVVSDIRVTSLDSDPSPIVYMPHTQLSIGLMTLVVRTDGEPRALTAGVGAAVRSIDPELPLADVRTMEEVVDATVARPRVVAVLLTAFALIALALAGVGVYGVTAYSVAQRTREIGVRMALGATPASVFRLVFGEGLRLVAAGLASGAIVAAAAAGLLNALLFEIDALDPWTFGGAALLLACVAALAQYVPARRGTRVTPTLALHAE